MGSSMDRESKRRSFAWNNFRFRHRISARNLVVAAICTLLIMLNVFQFQSNHLPQDAQSQEHDYARLEALLQANDRANPWMPNSDNKKRTTQKTEQHDPSRQMGREILTKAAANNNNNININKKNNNNHNNNNNNNNKNNKNIYNNNNIVRRNNTLSNELTFVTEEKMDYAFIHIITVLQRLGFQKKRLAEGNDWDLFWTFSHPFYGTHWPDLHNLQPHQRVNHIPAPGGMTTKVVLAKSGIAGIPPGFAIPEDADKLRRYAKDNPDALFVKKGIHHRGISILKVEDLDLKNTQSFVQEFVRNPLLIDGYKFDVGVYTIVTSIDPLRVFTFDSDVVLRFCPEKYLPLDAANVDKYVVGEKLRPTWEIEPLKKYYVDTGLPMKETLNAYIASLGKDPSVIWTKFEEIARAVMHRNERNWIEGLRGYKSKRNFFELFRLDFIVSEDLDVHLMEINSSPNLNSVRNPKSGQRKEQLLFNTFSLLNIARKTRSNSLKTSSIGEHAMQVFEKNLGVFPEICTSDLCVGSCVPLDCKLCKRCLTADTQQILEDAFIEHHNRMSCKRLIPPAVTYNDANKPLGNLSEANQLMLRWFQGKCLQNKEWCSP